MPRKFELLRDETTPYAIIPKGTIVTQETEDERYAYGKGGQYLCRHLYLITFLEAHPELFREIKPRKVFVIETEYLEGYKVRRVQLESACDKVSYDFTPLDISVRIEDRDP